jgi:3-(methylthio)propanoyl-CoA dehydrogenase
MANYYEDNADLRFYIEKAVDWEPLVRITEYDFRAQDGFENTAEAVDMYQEVLKLVGQVAADEVGPLGHALDSDPPTLVDGEIVYPEAFNTFFDQIKELELHGMCVPRELGGMNLPLLLFFVNTEILSRADVSIAAHHGFHAGIAMAMLAFSVDEGSTTFDEETAQIVSTRFEKELQEIVSGEAWGCMDITEPHAGSDMAAMRSRAEQDEAGNWTVSGTKIFITSGHGKYHFVICQTEPDKDGLEALSMFLVPTWTEDKTGKRTRTAHLDAIENKLGHKGSATMMVRFEDSPAQLIGERGSGFKQMLLLMNNARVGVGFECLGLCESAYRTALEFARNRPSMGKTIDRHEMIAHYLEEMRTDIQAIRALCFEAGIAEEMAQKIKMLLTYSPPKDPELLEARQQELKRYRATSRKLTPLLKYLAAERAVDMSRRCIQIHGGSGYMKDYGAEKLLRDAMAMPIYEGTSQIQSLMAMKDTLMGVVKQPQRFLRKAANARWRALSARSAHGRRLAKLEVLKNSAIQHLLSRLASEKLRELPGHSLGDWTSVLKDWDPKRDFSLALLHAERLCQLLTDVEVAKILHRQAIAHPEREDLLERYLERAEPRCRYLVDQITTTGARLLTELSEPMDEAAK